jgi:hypothetical protein
MAGVSEWPAGTRRPVILEGWRLKHTQGLPANDPGRESCPAEVYSVRWVLATHAPTASCCGRPLGRSARNGTGQTVDRDAWPSHLLGCQHNRIASIMSCTCGFSLLRLLPERSRA